MKKSINIGLLSFFMLGLAVLLQGWTVDKPRVLTGSEPSIYRAIEKGKPKTKKKRKKQARVRDGYWRGLIAVAVPLGVGGLGLGVGGMVAGGGLGITLGLLGFLILFPVGVFSFVMAIKKRKSYYAERVRLEKLKKEPAPWAQKLESWMFYAPAREGAYIYKRNEEQGLSEKLKVEEQQEIVNTYKVRVLKKQLEDLHKANLRDEWKGRKNYVAVLKKRMVRLRKKAGYSKEWSVFAEVLEEEETQLARIEKELKGKPKEDNWYEEDHWYEKVEK